MLKIDKKITHTVRISTLNMIYQSDLVCGNPGANANLHQLRSFRKVSTLPFEQFTSPTLCLPACNVP
jgi:hypothetical protein